MGPRKSLSLPRACLAILLGAAAGGFVFNWLMPQGLSWLPPEVARPLWRPLPLEEARALASQGGLLIDAREAGDYSQARLRGAVKLPAGEIDQIYRFLKPMLDKAPALLVYGQSTSRFPAATVAQFLRREGFDKVYVLEGCLDTLAQAGFDVQRPRRGGGA